MPETNGTRLVQRHAALAGGAHDCFGQWMLTALVQAGSQAQHLVGLKARRWYRTVKGRVAFCQGTGLVDDERVDLAQVFYGGGIAKQHALCRAATGCHHDELWQATFAVRFVAPGTNSAQISRYMVTVLDRDGDYQLLIWPSIVNVDTQLFKVATKYTNPVDSDGPLAQSLDRFVTAYLTSQDGATSLGQFVSAKFAGSAISNSPYSTAEIETIKASADTPVPAKAVPYRVESAVTVKASAAIETWSVMQLALRVSLGANNVWLVDGIDAPIGWGAITERWLPTTRMLTGP